MSDVVTIPYTARGAISLADASALNGLAKDLSDLFNNVRHGHLGPVLYSNGGSALFTKAIQTTGYNPFKGEVGLIQANLDSIADWAKDIENVIIVGPGPAVSLQNKEIPILERLTALKRISLVEQSPDFIRADMEALNERFPQVDVKAFEANFLQHVPHPSSQPALVISTGSLTNFENAAFENFPGKQLTEALAAFKTLAGQDGKVLWGYNSKLHDEGYQSQAIADFLLYPLHKAAQLQGIFIDPENYKYESKVYPQASHLAHQWVAHAFERVEIGGRMHHINPGDRFTMFSSITPDPKKVARLSKEQNMITPFVFSEDGGAVLHGFDCR